ncbi:hypothetical protein RFI_32768 [Reticulomyxa filosa]|uniref:non-specific serine/threonine protein kinase n=1 Tax=Reticulomyxa filosa TaxID=46433 RepID=X6LRV7_RETFI|nr:hypothetical protein RFI_32768 [Reticulomyxa filosa]|eukprot:ETO04628.1 hypothetical protein RFI_32768 [Reticulomyxa filosa]
MQMQITMTNNNISKQEVELLKELPEHPNIVKYIDSKQEQGFLFIILEFVEEGSLQALMKNFGGKFNEKVTALYIFQVHNILSGLQFLYKEGIIHRYIKASSVLVKEGKAKLTDFGVAIKRNNDSTEENNS